MTDLATEQLRTMILSRQLEPGRRVTQLELADMLGVSTMPIREAILRLAAEGFIIASANRSFEVAHTTEQGIRDVYWIHGILAGELAARAYDNRSDALLATLRDEHENYIAAMTAGDSARVTEANRRFHAAINSAAASPTVGVILRNTLHYFPDFNLQVPGWPELARRWQSRLLEHFANGDADDLRRVSQEESRTSGELFILAYWSDPDVTAKRALK